MNKLNKLPLILFIIPLMLFSCVGIYANLVHQDFENETVSIQFQDSSFVNYVEYEEGIVENPYYCFSTLEQWDRDELECGYIVNEFFGFFPPMPGLNPKKEFKKIVDEVKLADKCHMAKLLDKKLYRIKDTHYLYLLVEETISSTKEKFFYKFTYIITPYNFYRIETSYSEVNSDKENHEAFLNSLIITSR